MTLADAILNANAVAPSGIAFHAGEWVVYDLQKGSGNMTPEFICLGSGKMPVALNDTAQECLFSLIRSRL
jgi:hypothetical protein